MSFTNEIDSHIYNDYLEISPIAFQDKIRYFEKYRDRIILLPFNYSIEIQCDYVEALYHAEKYNKIIKVIDRLIETIIIENVYDIKGEDIFKSLLLIKANALHQCVEYQKSKYVTTELIKIDGYNAATKDIFIKNNIDLLRYDGQKIRGFSILMFLLSAFVIGIEILMVRSLFPEIVAGFVTIRNGLFCLGLCSYFGYEIYIRLKSKREYLRLLN